MDNFRSTRSLQLAYWDNLSKIYLTGPALKELRRRNPKRHPRFVESRHQFSTGALLRYAATHGKEIARFSRTGGPDLTDLIGYPLPIFKQQEQMGRHGRSLVASNIAARRTPRGAHKTSTRCNNVSFASSTGTLTSFRTRTRTSTSTRTRTRTPKTTTTPYDRNFQQHLIDHGIFPAFYQFPDGTSAQQPDNMADIKEMLTRRRTSLDPSFFTEEDISTFRRAAALAAKEKQVTLHVIPIIEGRIEEYRCLSGDIHFNNLDHLTDGTLGPTKPNLFYGAPPVLLAMRLRDELGGSIVPSTQGNLPILPNFFLEWKGPDGTHTTALGQALYDGALGARGFFNIQSFVNGQAVYDKKAYTIVEIYLTGLLELYTIHPLPPPTGSDRPRFVMTQVGGYALKCSSEGIRDGLAAHRNARDWTGQLRKDVIGLANERAASCENPTVGPDPPAEA